MKKNWIQFSDYEKNEIFFRICILSNWAIDRVEYLQNTINNDNNNNSNDPIILSSI